MALPITAQAKYWGVAGVVFLILLWLLGDILMPFFLGGAIAYFLNPIADRLEKFGLSRKASTAVISIAALLLMITVMLAIFPFLIKQLISLVETAPQIAKKLVSALTERFPALSDSSSTVSQTLASLGEAIKENGMSLASGAVSSVFGVVSVLVLVLVVPVVAFYMLLDWDHMIARVNKLLPRDHAPTIRRLASEVDTVLAGFVRGQVTVCIILGCYYAIALMLGGLQFGGIVGALSGTITFIPYVGALLGGTLAIGLALFQFWGDWISVSVIVAIFAFGQFIEGNILTPKLVGKSVGLHPVWLLLALSAFGSLFGFVGMLVAVPVAAVIGVLVRFAVERYTNSLLFTGSPPQINTPVEFHKAPITDHHRESERD